MSQRLKEAHFEAIAHQIALIRITDSANEKRAWRRNGVFGKQIWNVDGENSFSLEPHFHVSTSCGSQLFHLVPAVGENSFYGPRGFTDKENVLLENDNDGLLYAFRPKTPPPGYVCNSCNKPGHFIRFCPKDSVNINTSYQGPKRSVGVFECNKCKRKWTSSNSFAGQWQKCKKCHIDVRPKKQYAMEKAAEKGLTSKQRRAVRTSSMCSAVTVDSNTSSASYCTPSTTPPSEWSMCSTPASGFAFTF